MKFEEDLIINNEIDMDEEYDEENDDDFVNEYYHHQLINDMAISILLDWRKYCEYVGIKMCEKMNVEKIRHLIDLDEDEE